MNEKETVICVVVDQVTLFCLIQAIVALQRMYMDSFQFSYSSVFSPRIIDYANFVI